MDDRFDTGGGSASRRAFLEALGAAAGAICAGRLPAARGASSPRLAAGRSRVALTRAFDYEPENVRDRVRHLLDSLGGLGDVVAPGDRVVVKINCSGGAAWASHERLGGVPVTESVWTHPEILRATCEALVDSGVRGADITVAEAFWDAASFRDYGYKDVVEHLGAAIADLNTEAPYDGFVDLPSGPFATTHASFRVNPVLADARVYVSLPKLKDHGEASFTAALKNQVGMVPRRFYVTANDTTRRAALHGDGVPSSRQLPRSICDLNLARPVQLTVIDGVRNARGGEGAWVPTFRTAEDHVLLASKDPVAADAVALRLLDREADVADVRDPEAGALALPGGGVCDNYLDLLASRGAGTNRAAEIEAAGDGAFLIAPPESGAGRAPVFAQNAPNPFRRTTRFRFELPADAHVRIEIFDVVGRRVATVADRPFPEGATEIPWTPEGLAGGVYLARMTAGGAPPRSIRIVHAR